MHDVGAGFERDTCKVSAKFFAHAQVHLVVHEPQRHLRDLGGKLFDLDAEELVHVDADEAVHVHITGAAAGELAGTQHVQLQLTQLAVADDEEVTATTGRIEKREQAQLLVKLEQLVAVALDLVELGAQLVQKQGLDELENVLFAGVVGTQIAPGLLVHDALEQAAENGRADG